LCARHPLRVNLRGRLSRSSATVVCTRRTSQRCAEPERRILAETLKWILTRQSVLRRTVSELRLDCQTRHKDRHAGDQATRRKDIAVARIERQFVLPSVLNRLQPPDPRCRFKETGFTADQTEPVDLCRSS